MTALLLSPAVSSPPVVESWTHRAWVVFSGDAEVPWVRLLKPGFRHCFAVLHDGACWITVDPLAPFTEVVVQPVPASFDLPDWYLRQGLTVIPGPLNHGDRRPAPWRPFTCVEAVKRLLGLRAPWVFTPWQLYRHLCRNGG